MIFFRKSVDTILSDLGEKVGQLKAAIEHHTSQQEYHYQQSLTHSAEALRAGRVVGKIEDLIS